MQSALRGPPDWVLRYIKKIPLALYLLRNMRTKRWSAISNLNRPRICTNQIFFNWIPYMVAAQIRLEMENGYHFTVATEKLKNSLECCNNERRGILKKWNLSGMEIHKKRDEVWLRRWL